MKQDSLDLMCLKALKVNAESDRVALTAASIIVHAHAIARDRPDCRDEALRIIDLARRLYAIMPSQAVLGEMVDDGLGDIAAAGTDRGRALRARERLVARVWRYFHHGAGDAAPGSPHAPTR